MISNYIKVAWRILLKSKGVAMINTFGLVIGITGAALISMYVTESLSYDQGFSNSDRIYRLVADSPKKGKTYTSAQTYAKVATILTDKFAEVKHVTRLLPSDEAFLFLNATPFKEKLMFTDASFPKVFDIEMLLGNSDKCLRDPSSVIIARSLASKLFGRDWHDAKVVGATLMIDGTFPMNITGVFENLPERTHFRSNLFASVPSGDDSWLRDDSKVYTYVLLDSLADPKVFNDKLSAASPSFAFRNDEIPAKIALQRITDIHLNTGFEDENAATSDADTIYALIFVGGLLITISLANFMNLSMASAMNRVKEVGIRKSIGALGRHMRLQFFTEALLICVAAVLLSLVVIWSILPSVNGLMGETFTMYGLNNAILILLLVFVIVGAPAFASAYPVLYLSGMKAIEALKGRTVQGSSVGWRKGLVAVQLSISCIMISLSLVAWKQADIIKGKSLGFDKERVVVLSNPYMLGRIENIVHLKDELSGVRGVENISITGYTPSQSRWGKQRLTFPGREENSARAAYANWLMVDENFINTLGISLIDGRNFTDDHHRERMSIIINETAAQQFGLSENGRRGVGEELSFEGDGDNPAQHFTVVGIVKDFNFYSLYEPIKPVIMHVGYHRFEMALRLSNQYPDRETLTAVEKIWKKYLPVVPFEYAYLSSRFAGLHESDIVQGKVFSAFCVTTLLISGFGLFSIVAFAIISRTKEIGIRKVLGASAGKIVFLISRDYLLLIVVCFIISIPIAWTLCHRWIEHFAYKTEITWPIFVISFFVMVTVAFIALSYSTVKAAMANPVKNLRQE